MWVDVQQECTYNLAEIRKCMESPFLWALSELLIDTRNKEYSARVHWHLEVQAYKAYLESANFNNGMF